MNLTNHHELDALARPQSGVFTIQQALSVGLGRSLVQRRLAGGQWHRVAGRAMAFEPPPFTAWQLAWAAMLTWPDGVLTGPVAANLFGVPVGLPDTTVVYVPISRATLHRLAPRRRLIDPTNTLQVNGIRLMCKKLAIADCLSSLTWDDALNLYAWTSTREVFGHCDLASAVRDRHDRHGNAQLRRLLSVTRHGAVSAAEDQLHQLLRRHSLRGWRAGASVYDRHGLIAVVDVLFDDAKVVIEVDGRAAHSGSEAFVRDRRRQNRLVNAGFHILRFTWEALTRRPEEVLAQIRQALKLKIPGSAGRFTEISMKRPVEPGIT